MWGEATQPGLLCERTGLGFHELSPKTENSVNSLIISLTSAGPFILLNSGAWKCLDWKEPSYAHHCCPTSFREQTFLDP